MTYDTLLDIILHIILSLRSYNNCPVFSSGAPFFAWFRRGERETRVTGYEAQGFFFPPSSGANFHLEKRLGTRPIIAYYHQNHHEDHSN